MRNTADVTGGKPGDLRSDGDPSDRCPISGVSAINPLVAFYEFHGRKREVLFFYFLPDTKQVKAYN
jgi:hypothetical protein